MDNKHLAQFVGDFVTLQRGITYDGDLVGKPGVPLLGLGSIEAGGGFRASSYKTFGGECPPKIMAKSGDLYVALKGATKDGSMVGSIARLPPTIPFGRLTQDTARLDFKAPDAGLQSYLYWLLRTPLYRQYCDGRVTGSASASFSREDFLSFPVPEQTPESRLLVSIFDAIDAKIELNRLTNNTLTDLAAAVFKAWFVDFLPVKAKAAGAKNFPSMRQELFDTLPDKLVDSATGVLPAAWSERRIEDVAIINSWTLGKSDSLDVIDYIEISEVSRGEITTVSRFQRGDEPSRARRRLKHGDTALSTVRPDRGSHFLCLQPPDSLIASTGFCVLSPRGGEWAFLYSAMTRPEIGNELGRLADGGAYPAIRPEAIAGLPIVVPDDSSVIAAFDSLTRPLYESAYRNRNESMLLATLRDLLLPKLVSEEIRVSWPQLCPVEVSV